MYSKYSCRKLFFLNWLRIPKSKKILCTLVGNSFWNWWHIPISKEIPCTPVGNSFSNWLRIPISKEIPCTPVVNSTLDPFNRFTISVGFLCRYRHKWIISFENSTLFSSVILLFYAHIGWCVSHLFPLTKKGCYFCFRILANHLAFFLPSPCQAILSDYYIYHPDEFTGYR